MKNQLLIACLFITGLIKAQCVQNNANIFSFTTNGIKYELVKEKKTWKNAANCAVSRGGKLAEIESRKEQDSIAAKLFSTAANINFSQTISFDGGGASYIWLGGNDSLEEGKWIWDGNGDGIGTAFWNGTWSTGSAVNGAYFNWGRTDPINPFTKPREPDDFQNNQDMLAMGLENWPNGNARQWNDVKGDNLLYYLIEYPVSVGLQENTNSDAISLTLLDEGEKITVRWGSNEVEQVQLFDLMGQEIVHIQNTNTISVNHLPQGIYILMVYSHQQYKTIKYIKRN